MTGSVLIGVAGNERDADALALGFVLASALATEPLVVTVAPPRVLGEEPAPDAGAEASRAGLGTIAKGLAAAGYGEGRARKRVVLDWSPPRGLTSATRTLDAALLVVGSSHRGAVGRVLAGTVGTDVLSDAPCPVAIAPVGFALADRRPLNRVGVGYDGTSECEQVLDWASALAGAFGARLRVLTLTHPMQPVSPACGGDPARARQALNGVVVKRRSRELVVEAKLIEDLGARLTDESESDVLVVGSRRRGRLARFLGGSVSAETVRTAGCPVVVVPYAGDREAASAGEVAPATS